MSRKMKLLKAVAKVFRGMTVVEFNNKFMGMSEESIHRYLTIVEAERLQFGGADDVHR